jgi:hypothetical protein
VVLLDDDDYVVYWSLAGRTANRERSRPDDQ